MKKTMLASLLVIAAVAVGGAGQVSATQNTTNSLLLLPVEGAAAAMGEGSSIQEIRSTDVGLSGNNIEENISDEETVSENETVDVVITDGDAELNVEIVEEVPALDSDAYAINLIVAEDNTVEQTDYLVTAGAATTILDAPTDSVDVSLPSTGALVTAMVVTEYVKEQQAIALAEQEARDPEHFANLVIADCDGWVNVRSIPDMEGEVVGKLYDNSVGNFLEEENGWYKITSGNVTGYVKAEYCVTGEAAISLAREVGTRLATVNTTTLRVRAEAGTDAEVLGLVPIGEDLVVLAEEDGWVKVSIEEGEGYVSSEYVNLWTDFVRAESKAEEEARLAREERERQQAAAAAAAAEANRRASSSTTSSSRTSSSNSSATTYTVTGSGSGAEVAQYACQFVGNPYVYGGTSLTNGADCSGFVMSVYKAFGVSLPHSSSGDRSVGYAVEGGLANAQPGDIVCYSGHVAIYIGGGRIVHASTAATGIKISNADYRTPLAVRRIF